MAPDVLPRSAGEDIFGIDAWGYHQARLGYPDALIDHVFGYVGIGTPEVVEIGPGTGLATGLLLDAGARTLTAIEPDRKLGALLRRNIADPRLTLVQSGFLDAPLAPAAFDLAAAACSFHWVDPDRGYAKARDVIRPGGAVALWWHSYRNPRHDAFFAALAGSLRNIALPPSEGSAGYLYLDEARQRDLLLSHGFADVDHQLYRSERTLTAHEMRALYASFSFVRILAADARERLLDRIANLVETQFAGRAPNVVLTPLYLARRPVDE
ncbi:MAG TPA: methyltransferase domain-containing protein [Sphingomonas sp.]